MIIKMQKIKKSRTIVFLILFIPLYVHLSARENINYEKKFNKAKKMTIETMDGVRYNGFLLLTNDSLLVLWRARDVYNPDKIDDFCKKFKYSEINRIKIENKFRPKIIIGSFLGGVVVGGFVAFMGALSNEENAGIGGLFSGVLLTGAISAMGILASIVSSIDFKFKINGDIEKYKSALDEINEQAIFGNELLPEELRTYIEKNR